MVMRPALLLSFFEALILVAEVAFCLALIHYVLTKVSPPDDEPERGEAQEDDRG